MKRGPSKFVDRIDISAMFGQQHHVGYGGFVISDSIVERSELASCHNSVGVGTMFEEQMNNWYIFGKP